VHDRQRPRPCCDRAGGAAAGEGAVTRNPGPERWSRGRSEPEGVGASGSKSEGRSGRGRGGRRASAGTATAAACASTADARGSARSAAAAAGGWQQQRQYHRQQRHSEHAPPQGWQQQEEYQQQQRQYHPWQRHSKIQPPLATTGTRPRGHRLPSAAASQTVPLRRRAGRVLKVEERVWRCSCMTCRSSKPIRAATRGGRRSGAQFSIYTIGFLQSHWCPRAGAGAGMRTRRRPWVG
jgi:hypothetical protein